MFIGLDIEYQQCTTPRTTRLSQTLSGRLAARPQSPRAISQVREKSYDRMGFGFMHTVLKYQNEAIISCLTASGEIRDDCHSNRAKQGSYRCLCFLTIIYLLQLIYNFNFTYLMATMSPFVISTETMTGRRWCRSMNANGVGHFMS